MHDSRPAGGNYNDFPPGKRVLPATTIVWRVTEACPLACPFCGYSRDLVFPREAADPHAVQAFGRVLAVVQQQTECRFLVSWLGGEPLQWPELPRLTRLFAGTYQLQLGVTTSGHTLGSRAVRDELLAHYDQVTVSIDGIGEAHDTLRGIAHLSDHLQQSLCALRQEDAGGRLWRRVNTILMRDNVDQFANFCEMMADWHFHELTFNALGGNERPEFFRDHRLRPEQVERFIAALPGLRRHLAARNLLIRGSHNYLRRLAASAQNRQIAIDDCLPGRSFLFIDAQGRMSPCSFTSREYGIKITEIRTVDDFLNLQQRFREHRRHLRATACDDCHATHVFAKFGDPDTQPSQVTLAPEVGGVAGDIPTAQ